MKKYKCTTCGKIVKDTYNHSITTKHYGYKRVNKK